PDKLVGKLVEHLVNGETALLLGHFCVEENLQEEIAQLTDEFGPIPIINGLEDFIGLFKSVGLDGVEGLLAVPGAAARSTQAGHNLNCSFEALAGGGHQR